MVPVGRVGLLISQSYCGTIFCSRGFLAYLHIGEED